MRIPSSISIVLTAPSTSETGTGTSTSDSGSDTGHEGRSIRRHIKLRTASSSPGRSGCRKDLLSATPLASGAIVDHTETTARNSRLNIQTRSRGSSGSSLLNPAVGIAHHVSQSSENLPQPPAQGPEGREGGIGPVWPGSLGGSADNPSAPHYTIQPVDQSFVSLITTHIFATSFSHGSWQR